MQYSLEWIKRHIDGVLPPVDTLVREITEKAFEIEGVESRGNDTVIEAKILPDRAHDALSHRGMAREITALFGLKRKELQFGWPKTDASVLATRVVIENPDLCMRYIGVHVDGVSPKESPKWLRERLEAVGQRSINTIVDITNFVMFDIGQPMHAFDASKVKGGITVRLAKKGETMVTLDNKTLVFDGEELVIADDEAVLALAGVKGGKKADVDTNTTSIILESANFQPTRTRVTSVRHGIRTDASKRYENGVTSHFADEGAKEALSLLLELYPEARVAEASDVYPRPEREYKTGVSMREVAELLGADISEKEISAILSRAHIPFETVLPRERLLRLADLVVGKTYARGASVLFDAPERFDCSSLSSWLFKEMGYSIPRISVDQFIYASPVKEAELLPGDLVFTNTGVEKTKNGIYFESQEWMKGTKVPEGIDHVGIWLGDGDILHASSSHGSVVREALKGSAQFTRGVRYGRIIMDDETRFVVTAPPERIDLRRSHDLIEEICRHYGYNKINPVVPEKLRKGIPHKRLYWENAIRALLVSRGYSEVYTYSFAKKGDGDIEVMNPVGQDRPFIRRDLRVGIIGALVWNMYNGPLIGSEDVRIFEFGNIFRMEGGATREHLSLVLACAPGNKKRKKDFEDEVGTLLAEIGRILGDGRSIETKAEVLEADPATLRFGGFLKEIDFDAAIIDAKEPADYDRVFVGSTDVVYRPVSSYPFVTRDISLFVPATVEQSIIEDTLKKEAGDLVVRFSQFDRFHKPGEDRVSYGYRFVFQSFERTLTDQEVNAAMARVYDAAAKNDGWQVR